MAHGKGFGALLQANDSPPGQGTVHLSDGAGIQNHPPVNLPELIGLQFACQFLDRLADERITPLGGHQGIFIAGPKIADFLDRDETETLFVLDPDPFQIAWA